MTNNTHSVSENRTINNEAQFGLAICHFGSYRQGICSHCYCSYFSVYQVRKEELCCNDHRRNNKESASELCHLTILLLLSTRTIVSLQGTASPTVEKESFQRSLLAAQLANKSNGKKAVDAPPVNIGWDSHQAVVSIMQYMIIWTCRIEMYVCSNMSNESRIIYITLYRFINMQPLMFKYIHTSIYLYLS